MDMLIGAALCASGILAGGILVGVLAYAATRECESCWHARADHRNRVCLGCLKLAHTWPSVGTVTASMDHDYL